MQQRPTLRRVFPLISLTALCLTAIWDTSIYRCESQYTGKPLPVLALAQLAAQPARLTPVHVHLRGAIPRFGQTAV